MPNLADLGARARSKNAGPFWITIDVFCGSSGTFDTLRRLLRNDIVFELFQVPADSMKRFEIADLNVIKLSFPRPVVQGSRFDRDMHGAQAALLLAEHEFEV